MQNFKVLFLKSAAKVQHFPSDHGIEIAFVGRSNAGKSTALNVIAGIKQLARTSKTPGRTQLINFFTVDATRRLVDLPGYGFAEVPKEMKLEWQHLIANYLHKRRCLKGVVWLVDARHLLTKTDLAFLPILQARNFSVLILLTKADKLSASARLQAKKRLMQECDKLRLRCEIILFSQPLKLNLAEVRNWLNHLFVEEQLA